MAADYTFDPGLVFDDTTLIPSVSAVGVLLDVAGGSAQTVYDLNGNPLPLGQLTTNNKGYVGRFRADIPDGVVSFGSVLQPVTSKESQRAGVQAAAAQASALASLTAANAASAQAAQAAAAAQAAQASAAALAGGGTGGTGGLDGAALDARMGGSTAGLIDKMVMPRFRINATTWETRPDCRCALTIGADPDPADMLDTDVRIRVIG